MLRNSAAFAGLGCATPTNCTKVVAGLTRPRYDNASSALPGTASQPGGSRFCECGRTSALTRWPRASNCGIRRLPMYPVPPVMNTCEGELFMRVVIYHLCLQYATSPQTDS